MSSRAALRNCTAAFRNKRIGNMTRSVRIDELPQRICILSGMRHRWLNAPDGRTGGGRLENTETVKMSF